ncbi:MAG TPA: hypothetical protein DEA43_02370 [Candidatus Moranbacteria bacterium]|nr:hypothetical protein [Candidatus Moranbacteria bacterium]HBT45710.1 hypothetical protein [Candidatus Moranbacteria bacterium]
MQKKVLLWIAVGTGGLLLIPLVAMQFTDQVVWTLSDFVIAGFLLFSTGVILAWATRKFPKHKIIVGALIVFAFIWLWAELAVGIFTNWGS